MIEDMLIKDILQRICCLYIIPLNGGYLFQITFYGSNLFVCIFLSLTVWATLMTLLGVLLILLGFLFVIPLLILWLCIFICKCILQSVRTQQQEQDSVQHAHSLRRQPLGKTRCKRNVYWAFCSCTYI